MTGLGTGVGSGLGHIAAALSTLQSGGSAADTTSSTGVPFAGVMRAMVEQTTALNHQAEQAVTGVSKIACKCTAHVRIKRVYLRRSVCGCNQPR